MTPWGFDGTAWLGRCPEPGVSLMNRSRLPLVAGALLAGATLVVAVPAAAQDYPADQRDYPAYQGDPDYPDTQEDIVVEGRWGRVRDDVDTMSQRVSYAAVSYSRLRAHETRQGLVCRRRLG